MEVLADTSVWIAHFRNASADLKHLLITNRLLMHPLVLLELACVSPPAPRKGTLGRLRSLPQAPVATVDEVLAMVEGECLYDRGCGAVDLSLLTSVRLRPGTKLWTLDRDLGALARRFKLTYAPVMN
ncbi:MAG: VapC toxin family PIN domain ribonuclease [Pseudomonadota bacterium]|nr:VapC toxin family PIN domain ribonuclease [Pseudomonadota bacterium]